MKEYGLNKIFVEGKSDKLFIDFLLKSYFEIEDLNLVIDVKGKDKLIDQPLLADIKRKEEKAKNIIIFDTDSTKINGGRKQRIEDLNNIEIKLDTKFEIYLLPFNDEREGILEDLLNICVKKDFNFFDKCWSVMLSCIGDSKAENLNIPAQKAFLYSKIDLFKKYRSTNWDYKGSTVYDYSDKNIWEINPDENIELKKLLDFINDNLFND
ncbi:DUF3226 domain-containing protein [Flavobacterium salmonis]|uniref:DUF4435 domain-containing protein n=1 Tax=Flavobacterium salmonis TaxID=2654844 RepID=A0A6V6YQR1_9FLAO|nr:DUF3226 domain-containing protein [Flavobacterium salmonis]CAD0001763.1 hypothetical protein FLAT13_00788 [Flavobacterium salmonis]